MRKPTVVTALMLAGCAPVQEEFPWRLATVVSVQVATSAENGNRWWVATDSTGATCDSSFEVREGEALSCYWRPK